MCDTKKNALRGLPKMWAAGNPVPEERKACDVLSVPSRLMNFSICVKFMDAVSALVKKSHYNYNY